MAAVKLSGETKIKLPSGGFIFCHSPTILCSPPSGDDDTLCEVPLTPLICEDIIPALLIAAGVQASVLNRAQILDFLTTIEAVSLVNTIQDIGRQEFERILAEPCQPVTPGPYEGQPPCPGSGLSTNSLTLARLHVTLGGNEEEVSGIIKAISPLMAFICKTFYNAYKSIQDNGPSALQSVRDEESCLYNTVSINEDDKVYCNGTLIYAPEDGCS